MKKLNVGLSQQLLTSFGTKVLVDFGLVQVVTYGAFFGFCDISGVYAISGEKFFCVLYLAFSLKIRCV